MDTLLLTFANNPADLLPTLQDEDETLNQLLLQRHKAGHFFLHSDSYTKVEELASHISKHRDDLALFHYSGHAGRDRLHMGDGAAYEEGLAQLLGQCPRLQVVFLNGCSTQGLVERLLREGVRVVIATSAPVEDQRATFFSKKFYDALVRQDTLREAFVAAKAALALAFKNAPEMRIHRAVGSAAGQTQATEPVWGMFCAEKNEPSLDWRLPLSKDAAMAQVAQFKPNKLLVETLIAAFSKYNSRLPELIEESKSPLSEVDAGDVTSELLKTLPAPLSEPIRKLVMEKGGYDQLDERRLGKLVEAYSISVELLAFVILAQLWDAYYAENQVFTLKPEQRATLAQLFKMDKTERERFDFIPFIHAVREIFEEHEIQYFIPELKNLRELINKDYAFTAAVNSLAGMRLRLLENRIVADAVPYQCKEAEENLALVYDRLSYMARFRLATVLGIDVMKYRHKREPEYNHSTRFLHNVLGKYELKPVPLKDSWDNRSILFVDLKTQKIMNLTPFIIDKNAFEDKTELTNLYFFSHYHRPSDTCYFRHLQNAADPLLEVRAEGPYRLVKEQFDAFANLLLQKPLSEA